MTPPPLPKAPSANHQGGSPVPPVSPQSPPAHRADSIPNKLPSRRRHLILATGGIALAALALVFILSRGTKSGHSLGIARNNPREDFRVVCRATMDAITGPSSSRPSEGEQRFRKTQLQEDLASVAQGGSQLAPIALQWLAIQTNAMGSLQEGGGAIKDLLHIWLEDKPEPQRSRTRDARPPKSKDGMDPHALRAGANLATQVFNFRELVAQRREIQAGLLHLAPKFSGDIDPKASFTVQFLEQEPDGLGKLFGNPHSDSGPQILNLRNDQGKTLSHCVIAVRLSQPEEQDRLFCYYAEHWPSGSELRAEYPTGWLGESHVNVNRVSVTVHSHELSSQPIQLRRRGNAWPYYQRR